MKHRNSARKIFLSLFATAALAVSGCSAGSEGGDSALVIANASQPASFSWETQSSGYATAEFNLNTGATLIRNAYVKEDSGDSGRQDLYKFDPVLAKSYEVSADGLTYTFHLNTEAKSAAGNSLSADDVVFSIERKFKVPTSPAPTLSAPILTDPSQVKKIDDATVTFTVADKAYGYTLLSLLANVPYNIYDSKILKENATPEDPYAVAWSQNNPQYGFGAYKLASYKPGEEIVLEANPGYVLGEPKVKRVVQRVVSDPGQRGNIVKAGDAGIATELRPVDQSGLADSDKAYAPSTTNPNAWLFMPLNNKVAPFDDVRVRQALAKAIPYEDIMKDVYRGRVGPISSLIDPLAPGFVGDGLKANTTDTDEAVALLAAAGYSKDKPLAFTLTIDNTVPDIREAAVRIQSAASAANINIEIDAVTSSVFFETITSKKHQAAMLRDYAIVQSPSYVLNMFHRPDSPINWGNFENDEFYAAMEKGLAAGDPVGKAAGQEWNTAQRILQDQMPEIYIGLVQPLPGFNSKVQGFVFRTDNAIDYTQLTIK